MRGMSEEKMECQTESDRETWGRLDGEREGEPAEKQRESGRERERKKE